MKSPFVGVDSLIPSCGHLAPSRHDGFFAITLVLLLVTLTILALLGPYQVLLADWLAIAPQGP